MLYKKAGLKNFDTSLFASLKWTLSSREQPTVAVKILIEWMALAAIFDLGKVFFSSGQSTKMCWNVLDILWADLQTLVETIPHYVFD